MLGPGCLVDLSPHGQNWPACVPCSPMPLLFCFWASVLPGPIGGWHVVACLLGGSLEVFDVSGIGVTAVVCSVDRAVDLVAELSVNAVCFVVAHVTVGAVAVDLMVAVGAGAEVARVVMAEVAGGDSAGAEDRAPSSRVPPCPALSLPVPGCS